MDRREYLAAHQDVIDALISRLPELQRPGGHDAYHVLRVYNNAVEICHGEGTSDSFVVAASALLHDVGHDGSNDYTQVDDHELESGRTAARMLLELGVDADTVGRIRYAITVHRASKGITPDTVEARILQDADRLDALGALAVARTFAYDSRRPIYDPAVPPKSQYDGISSTSLNHLIEKVLSLTPERFHTLTAKEIARHRHAFVEAFVNEFLEEWSGRL